MRKILFTLLFAVLFAGAAFALWSCEAVENGQAFDFSSIDFNSSVDSIFHMAHLTKEGIYSNHLRYCEGTYGSWSCEYVPTGVYQVFDQMKIIAAAGNSSIFFYAGNPDYHLGFCQGTLGSWTCEAVDEVGESGHYPTALYGNDGNFHAVHFDNTNDYYRYCEGNLGNWTCENVVTTTNGYYSSIAQTSDGNLHFSYQTAITNSGNIQYCTGTLGNWTCGDTVKTSVGLSTTVAASDDSLHIFMVSSTLYHCYGTRGSWTCETVESGKSATRRPGVIQGTDGNFHISNYDSSSDDLRYCEGTTGTWTCEAVDTAGDRGTYSDITEGSDGNMSISFIDETEDDLRYCYQTLNTAPTISVTKIDSYADNGALPAFSSASDGNLTIDFNVLDADSGDTLTVDLNYSSSNTQGTGTSIVNDLVLSAAVCEDADFTDSTECSYDFNIASSLLASDGNYFILAFISDGTVSATNESDKNFMVDNNAPSISITSPASGAVQSENSVTIEYTASDSNSGIASYSVSTDGSAWTDNGTGLTYTFTDQTSGSKTYYARATDNAGNNGTANVSITINLPSGGGTTCGDHACNGEETAATCARDCSAVCGDGACTHTENRETCPFDCGISVVCGDNVCEGGENAENCPADCEGQTEEEDETPNENDGGSGQSGGRQGNTATCDAMNCDDDNPCTNDSCENATCFNIPKQDGTSCGAGKECSQGACIEKQAVEVGQKGDTAAAAAAAVAAVSAGGLLFYIFYLRK